MKKTIEEAAEERYREYPNNPLYEYNRDANCFRKRKAFIAGAKYQSEQMYSDMQEYAEFCIRCHIEGLPLLSAKDWFTQYKSK